MNKSAHVLHIKANPNRVRAMFQGHVIADTDQALTVYETGHSPVQYFPRHDVETGFLGRTAHHTLCPYKGEASYFTLVMDGEIAENAVWSYEDPILAASLLKDRLAFYPDVVEVYEMTPAEEALEPRAARPHGQAAG
jgi:uncharacterized protein (DUF427 family)